MYEEVWIITRSGSVKRPAGDRPLVRQPPIQSPHLGVDGPSAATGSAALGVGLVDPQDPLDQELPVAKVMSLRS
jgi:hypothetical protein